MDVSAYDFIDLGARDGGSLRMATNAFGGVGLGVDINKNNVEAARAKGFDAVVADATALPMEDSSVGFCQALHFLEHLPDRETAEKVLENAVRAARDFVLILGPDFSGKRVLAEQGFVKYFATWEGHSWQHTANDFQAMLQKYSQYKSSLIQFDRILDSWSPVILPAGVPKNQKRYDPSVHPVKPWVTFKPKIFEHIAFVILKNDRFSPEEILFRAMKPRVTAQVGYCPLYERVPRASAVQA